MDTPYPERMFRWTLKKTMDAQGVTRYALAKHSGLSMNAVRAMYDGTPTRVDLPAIDKVVASLHRLTGQVFTANDVLMWFPDPAPPAPTPPAEAEA